MDIKNPSLNNFGGKFMTISLRHLSLASVLLLPMNLYANQTELIGDEYSVQQLKAVNQNGEQIGNNNTKPDSVGYAQNEILVLFKSDQKINGPLFQVQGSTNNDNGLSGLINKYNAADMKRVLAKYSGSTQAYKPFSSQVDNSDEGKLKNLYKVSISGDPAVAAKEFSLLPEVIYAEPNYKVQINMVPDDKYYSTAGSWGQSYDDLWGLKAINAESAWDKSQGEGVVVAVIDTGIYFEHEDLEGQIWVNTAEIPDNGIDDDGNGYVDDVSGYNFVDNNSVARDDHGHGTHVSGTIAAKGNNGIGIIGVAPKAKIMPIKGLDVTGSGLNSDLINALFYAADMGADVINNSWGGYFKSQALNDAINYAHDKGTVVIAAAGNNNAKAKFSTPGNIGKAITVGAIEQNQNRADYSNYGDNVDVFAPGSNILSLLCKDCGFEISYQDKNIDDKYIQTSGTSMATPHVAGAAALLLANNPEYTPDEIRYILRSSAVDNTLNGWDENLTYGVMDIDAALSLDEIPADLLAAIETPEPYEMGDEHYYGNDKFVVKGSSAGNDFSYYELHYAKLMGYEPESFNLIGRWEEPVSNDELGIFDAADLADGEYIIRLRVYSSNGKYSESYRSVQKDSSLKEGWPRVSEITGKPPTLGSARWLLGHMMPLYADLNNDGEEELYVSNNSQIFGWNKSGKDLSGFPITIPAELNSTATHLATADLDGDGDLELVVGLSGKKYLNGKRSTVLAYHHTGEVVKGFPGGNLTKEVLSADSNEYKYYINEGLITGDFDNDGMDEIVFQGGWGNSNLGSRVDALMIEGDGSIASGWPVNVSRETNSPNLFMAAADFDNDGVEEILIRRIENLKDPIEHRELYVELYNYNGEVEKSLNIEGFTGLFSSIFGYINLNDSPVIVDVDGDNDLEIIISTEHVDTIANSPNAIFVLDHNLNVLPAWPIDANVDGNIQDSSNVYVVNVDSDSDLEIAYIYKDSRNDAIILHARNLDGSLVDGYPITGSDKEVFRTYSSAYAYLDKAPQGALFFENNAPINFKMMPSVDVVDIYANSLPGWPKPIGSFIGVPAISTPAKSGNTDIAVVTDMGLAYVFEELSYNETAAPISNFLADSSHSGVADIIAPMNSFGDCNQYTATNAEHVTAARATEKCSFEFFGYCYGTKSYIAVGSEDNLGSNGSDINTLKEDPVGYFSLGECPVVESSSPEVVSSNIRILPEKVLITGSAVDVDKDLVKVEVELDNSGEWVRANGRRDWTLSLYGLEEGPHVLNFKATDLEGRESIVVTESFDYVVVDYAPKIDSWNVFVDGNFIVVNGKASDGDGDLDHVVMTATGYPEEVICKGIDEYACWIVDMPDGRPTIKLVAYDIKGNSSDPVEFEVSVGIGVPPEIVSADYEFIGNSVFISGTANDADGDLDRVIVTIDDEDILCIDADEFTCELGELLPGTYAASVTAYDSFDSPSDPYAIEVVVSEESAPTIDSFDYYVAEQNIRVTGTASDADNDLSYIQLEYANGEKSWNCSGTYDFECLILDHEVGTYDFVIAAYDEAGNRSQSEVFTIEFLPAECIEDTNANHFAAGRAVKKYYYLYYSTGVEDYLGYSFTRTSLRKVPSSGWEKVASCN